MDNIINFLILGVSTYLLGIFCYLDGYSIVKNVVVVKYNKFKKINRLVSTNYKGFFVVLWISVCLIFKALWISFLQYINSSIIKIDGNKYILSYVIKGKLYKMVIKPVRGPSKVLLVSNEKHEDVSHNICPYLGPEENFHGCIYNPEFFKYNELVFELSNGCEHTFKNKENIIF